MHKLIPESLSTKIDKFKQELISRLSDIEQKGYQVKETVDDTDITRNDLYETRLRNKTR